MYLTRYQEQHLEIHSLAEGLDRELQAAARSFDAAGARVSLVTLAARLNIHLAFEDKALYPTLLLSANELVKTKALTYLKEVGGLKQAMTTLLQRWLSTEKVTAEPEVFRKEALVFLRALERRLQAEDQEFYPLLERLA